tara:strand:- start:601 stop:708 length:108 start_codon:yes stop_codon:yes gene_type:complete
MASKKKAKVSTTKKAPKLAFGFGANEKKTKRSGKA